MNKNVKNIILIDGYNVLRCGDRYSDLSGEAPNFKDWDSSYFNSAREALYNDVFMLADSLTQIFIIYDGKNNFFDKQSKLKSVNIIFGNCYKTADNIIEKLAWKYISQNKNVTIVTDDNTIRNVCSNKSITMIGSTNFCSKIRDKALNISKDLLKQNKKFKKSEYYNCGASSLENIVPCDVKDKLRILRDSL